MTITKYFFGGDSKPGQWYGLISSSLDRLYLLSNEYEIIKILQLCFMQNELFYIVDMNKIKSSTDKINNTNCLEYTLSGAKRLHLEPDVDHKKIAIRELEKKQLPIKDSDVDLQQKLFFCYSMIKNIINLHRTLSEQLQEKFKQELHGLEITKGFIEHVLGDDDFYKIVERDQHEVLFPIRYLNEFKNGLLRSLTYINYDQNIDAIKKQFKNDLEEIDSASAECQNLKKILLQCL